MGTGAKLHIVRPMKFMIDDKSVRRAGLDYWQKLEYRLYDSWQELCDTYPQAKFYLASTKAKKFYDSVNYEEGDFLVFGPESKGLPEMLLDKHSSTAITIPMHPNIRSINLSNSVAIVLYEAARQRRFKWKNL